MTVATVSLLAQLAVQLAGLPYLQRSFGPLGERGQIYIHLILLVHFFYVSNLLNSNLYYINIRKTKLNLTVGPDLALGPHFGQPCCSFYRLQPQK